MFAAFLIYLVTLWLTLDTWNNHGVWFAMLVFMAARGALLGLHYPKLARLVRASDGT